jgi:hypothetical protein
MATIRKRGDSWQAQSTERGRNKIVEIRLPVPMPPIECANGTARFPRDLGHGNPVIIIPGKQPYTCVVQGSATTVASIGSAASLALCLLEK